MYSVIIPNKFDDIIKPLLHSIKMYEKAPHVVIVADNHDRSYGYDKVRVDGPFNFSRSVNEGIRYTSPNDVIVLNDDVRLIQENTFEKLSEISYSDPFIGILSPLIDGGCGNLFQRLSRSDLWETDQTLHLCNARSGDRVTFACVYIRRRLFNKIGFFDENFGGLNENGKLKYGFDDADMSIRCVNAGWKLAITNQVAVRHGEGGSTFERGKNWNGSFKRVLCAGAKENLAYLQQKYPK